MTIAASCMFCKKRSFLTRATYIHPYTPEEIELIKKIDKNKLAALRKEHNNWLIACYECLVEKCPLDDDKNALDPRPSNLISIQEP